MDDSTSQQPPPPEASPGLQGAGILDDLAWRGLLASTTDLGVLREQLDREPMTLYVGFDPTAASLHVGHLAQTLTARRFQLAGHRVLLLVGGATGLIGDPKPTAERALNEAQTVHGWAELIRAQLSRFFEFSGPNPARMVNNYEWTQHLSVIDFLRDIGKHFSVNRMLDREAVARRLGDQGISYTEFSYVLLQSLDFLELYRRYGCRLQTGGSDQFGNIVAGVDLIRRVEGAAVHALTTPLVTKADGTKFGKTEGGALWLDPALTSPYAFYQYWLNTDDRDIAAYLKMFSFQTRDHIESLLQAVVDRPEQRAAQRALAQELTELVHGPAALASVMAASAALFGGGSLRDVDEGTLTAALSETPFAEVDFGPATTVVDLLVATGLAASRGAARRTIKEGGAYLNNVRVVDDSEVVQADSALAGGWFVLRRGRRNIAGVTVRRG